MKKFLEKYNYYKSKRLIRYILKLSKINKYNEIFKYKNGYQIYINEYDYEKIKSFIIKNINLDKINSIKFNDTFNVLKINFPYIFGYNKLILYYKVVNGYERMYLMIENSYIKNMRKQEEKIYDKK